MSAWFPSLSKIQDTNYLKTIGNIKLWGYVNSAEVLSPDREENFNFCT